MNLFPVPALRPARGTPGPTIRERIWRDQSTQPEAHEIPVRLASPHFARGLRVVAKFVAGVLGFSQPAELVQEGAEG